MCGIAGATGSIDPLVHTTVARMTRSIAHRGPDAEGVWPQHPPSHAADGVVLGHRRLAIIDLDTAADQPMIDPDTANVIAFNGEIFNYRELASDLRARGHEFKTRSDTEVLLKAYAEWGHQCVRRLRGMFAFAIWDANQHELFLARDHVGVKPLYATSTTDSSSGAQRFYFASELRPLLLVQRQIHLNPRAVESFLWHGFVASNHGIADGIWLVPPGSTLTVAADGNIVRQTTFWTLPASAAERTDDTRALANAVEEAITLRLVSDAPLGIFLSGGIDSSAVASIAARTLGSDLRTFNLAFEETEFDEAAFAQEVATNIGSHHQQITLTQETFLDSLEDALDCVDQPTFDALNSYFISRAVKNAGVTVALAGTGGDELFGGYRSFREIPTLTKAMRLLSIAPRPLRRAAARVLAETLRINAGPMPRQTRWGKIPDLIRSDASVLDLYQYSYAIFTDDVQERLFLGDRELARSRGLDPDEHRSLTRMLDGEPQLHAISLCEFQSFIRHRLLRDTDAASMAVALEARVPLLDYRVIEEAAKLTDHARFKPLGKKQLLQQIGLDPKSRAVMSRPKSGFVLPIDRWCREALRSQVEATLCDHDLCRACGLNPEVVEAIWRSFISGSKGMYWSRVWAIFVLLRWCRRHGVYFDH